MIGFATIASVLSLAGLVAAAPTPQDSGWNPPIGRVLSPAQNTRIVTSQYGNGGIYFDYEITLTPEARTHSLWANLRNSNYSMVAYLGKEAVNPKTNKITAYWATPVGFCGDFYVSMTENMWYQGSVQTPYAGDVAVFIDCNAGNNPLVNY